MTKAPRGRYTRELKRQAVSMVVDDGFGVAEAAGRLSLCSKTLSNWVKQYRQDEHWFLSKPGVSEQDAELARLRMENALLRMERDILKKAAAYFLPIAPNLLERNFAPGERNRVWVRT